jgi:hypothetical protein
VTGASPERIAGHGRLIAVLGLLPVGLQVAQRCRSEQPPAGPWQRQVPLRLWLPAGPSVLSLLLHAVGAAGAVPTTADPAEAAHRTGNGIAAHEAVGATLCAVRPHPGDPLAAIAGSIAGAWAGASSISERLVARIEQRAASRRWPRV